MSRKPSDIPNPHAARAPVRVLEPAAGRAIRRRDFLNGLLIGASASILGAGAAGCDGETGETTPDDKLPPGNDKGDNNTICHQVRDGKTWEIPAASGQVYDCVIIGGGISGLCAAYQLKKRGAKSILVLEKEDPIGGFARKDGPAASPWGQASAYTVYPYNDNLIEIYTDLGIITGMDADGYPILDEKFVINEPTNNSFIKGKWYADPWNEGIDKLPYDAALKDSLTKFRDKMIEWYEYTGADDKFGFDTPSDASTTDANVRALDDISFSDYIAQEKWSPEVAEFYRPYCRSAFGADPEDLSAWAAINFFGSEFQPAMSQPGGNAHLALKFAELVGAANIKTSCFVIQAKNEGDEVHVSYVQDDKVTTLKASSVIYAGPRYLARYVLPDLVTANRDEAKEFKYTPYIVANVHVKKTPAGLGYDNWIQDVDTMFADIVLADWAGLDDPAKASLDRANTLSCYCPLIGDNRRAELLATKFEVYEKQVLDDLEKVFPGIGEDVTGVDIYRWGHAMLASGPGFIFGKARTDAQKPEGRIFFANHDVDGLPAFENATAAAFRASQEVVDLLML